MILVLYIFSHLLIFHELGLFTNVEETQSLKEEYTIAAAAAAAAICHFILSYYLLLTSYPAAATSIPHHDPVEYATSLVKGSFPSGKFRGPR